LHQVFFKEILILAISGHEMDWISNFKEQVFLEYSNWEFVWKHKLPICFYM
jgi:hypothetical protein